MSIRSLPLHEPLSASSRVARLAAPLRGSPLLEVGLLVLLGAGASVLTLQVDLGIRVPGHSILRGVLPLALGMALVPRRFSGSVMASAAMVGLLLQGIEAGPPGWGSTTSLVLTGPFLDLALRGARSGKGVWLALVVAGTAANLAAFAVRLCAKILVHDGSRPLASWWPEAILTYAICGLVAGVVSAAILFRPGSRSAAPA